MTGNRNNRAEFKPSQPTRKLNEEVRFPATAAPRSKTSNEKINKGTQASSGRPTSLSRPLSPPLARARSAFELPTSFPTSPDLSLAPMTARGGRTTSFLEPKAKSLSTKMKTSKGTQTNMNRTSSFKKSSSGSRPDTKSSTRAFGQNYGPNLKNSRKKSPMKPQNNTSIFAATSAPEPELGPEPSAEPSILILQDTISKNRNGKSNVVGVQIKTNKTNKKLIQQSSMPSINETAPSTTFEKIQGNKAIKILLDDREDDTHSRQKASSGRMVFTSTHECEPVFEDISAHGGCGKAALSPAMVMPRENESNQPAMDDSTFLDDREDDKVFGLLEKTNPKHSRKNNHRNTRRSDSWSDSDVASKDSRQTRPSGYKDSRQRSYTDSRYETSLVKKTRESYQRQSCKRDEYILPYSARERINMSEKEDRISKVIDEGLAMPLIMSGLIEMFDNANIACEDAPALVKAQSEGIGDMCVGTYDAFFM